ncbi:unnamed protein product [Cuscuta campestris]|uniref:Uncharacterized protein n=1 Tax=Cuscuta campestris TaxID=132261 RepID=A0A484KIF8_9ASTE|nr:unnamed protein product [Cuscuta campestris]
MCKLCQSRFLHHFYSFFYSVPLGVENVEMLSGECEIGSTCHRKFRQNFPKISNLVKKPKEDQLKIRRSIMENQLTWMGIKH